jgi:AraC-like DNA-binding protein/mannose-6-phosphate isomerase-like protein (cupin superfamily)
MDRDHETPWHHQDCAEAQPAGAEEVVLSEWSSADPGARELQRHEAYEISMVEEEEGLLRIGEEVVSLEKGDLFLIPPGREHLPMARGTGAIKLLTLHCLPSLLDRILAHEGAAGLASEKPAASPKSQLRKVGPRLPAQSRGALLGGAILRQLWLAKPIGGHARRLWVRSKLLDLMALLLGDGPQASATSPRVRRTRGRYREAIAGLVETLPRLDLLDITVEGVARQLDLSVRHFTRLFREQTGQTFNAYLTDLRVRHAKQLLATTDQKIIDVAWEAGYGSLSQFNLVFKKKTGSSPREYRARHRRV